MIIDLNADIAFSSQKTNPLLWIYMQVLHNLVNGPQRLTSSRPFPKCNTQYKNGISSARNV
jgi:hypothetical protein